MVVSFVVLVGVMIVNKVRGRAKPAEATQVATADPAKQPRKDRKDQAPRTTPSSPKVAKSPKTHVLPTLPKEDKDDAPPPAKPAPAPVQVAVVSADAMPDISDLPPDPKAKPGASAVVAVGADDENTPPDSDLPAIGGRREPPAAQAVETPAATLQPAPAPAPTATSEQAAQEKAEGQARSEVASREMAPLPDLSGSNPAAEPADAPSADTLVAATQGTAQESAPSDPPPSGSIPNLESPPPVVATPAETAPRPAEPGGEKRWIRLPNARGKREPASEPVGEMTAAPEPTKVTPAPKPDPEAEVVLHTVRAGEDFASLARYYYNSTRFRRALWEANRKRVPSIDDLPPGTTIRVPMPEALDPSLIPPAGEEVATEPARPAASKSKSIARRDSQARRTSRPESDLVPMDEGPARRPTYVVRQGQTLRSIARDTMDDPHRDGEILELNRDVIEDPRGRLPQGLRLALPDDARTGRRVR